MFRLIVARRFGPLFVTQALGAFNDNLFRSAMLFLIAFRLMAGRPGEAALAASLSGAVFILPYLLFSSVSGQIADRIDKARIARAVKIAEVAIMGVGAAALLLPSLPLLYGVLFAMGVHSTVFGPIKYAMLPQHLREDELVRGNGLIEAATFLAILAGQIAGGLLSTPIAVAALLCVAAAGLVASLFIPPAPPLGEAAPVDWNLARGAAAIARPVLGQPKLRHAVIGISWFFALGGVLTQQFVPLVARIGAPPVVAVICLALFSIGVAIGALLVVRVMRGRVTARPVLPAAIVLTVATGLLAAVVAFLPPLATGAGSIAVFASPQGMMLAAVLVVLAAAGGTYVVPLYATLQTAAHADARARAVAANNIVNALAMVGLTLVAGAILSAGSGDAGLFAAMALIGLAPVASARRLGALG